MAFEGKWVSLQPGWLRRTTWIFTCIDLGSWAMLDPWVMWFWFTWFTGLVYWVHRHPQSLVWEASGKALGIEAGIMVTSSLLRNQRFHNVIWPDSSILIWYWWLVRVSTTWPVVFHQHLFRLRLFFPLEVSTGYVLCGLTSLLGGCYVKTDLSRDSGLRLHILHVVYITWVGMEWIHVACIGVVQRIAQWCMCFSIGG